MRSGKRLGVALLGAAVTLALSAMPASATDVTGGLDKSKTVDGLNVKLTDGSRETHLFSLKLDDGTVLSTYCINIKISVDYNEGHKEVPWDAYPDASSSFGENRAEINWLLQESYPFVGLEALATKLSLNDLTVKEAIAGTQAAAWHFSDNKKLAAGNAKNVETLYNFLTGEKNVGLENVPALKLDVAPKTLAGEAGKRIGPFKVSTTGGIKKLNSNLPNGVKLTDKDGKELSAGHLVDGSEIFVDVPAGTAAGKGSFDLSAASDVGRVFVAKEKDETQNMIVAQAEAAKVTVKAEATWAAAQPTTSTTPAPQASNGSELANTGVSIFVPISIGVLLLLAGGGALLFLRRRGRA